MIIISGNPPIGDLAILKIFIWKCPIYADISRNNKNWLKKPFLGEAFSLAGITEYGDLERRPKHGWKVYMSAGVVRVVGSIFLKMVSMEIGPLVIST